MGGEEHAGPSEERQPGLIWPIMMSKLRQMMLGRVLEEYERTQRQMDAILGGTFPDRRPRLWETIVLRAPGLLRLVREQIRLLRQWRKNRKASDLTALLVTVNAIASGLKTTG